MSSIRISFEELEALAPKIERRLQNLANFLKVAVARRVFMLIVEKSPVGPAVGDPHTGLFRASNAVTAGAPNTVSLPAKGPSYPIPGAAEFDAGVTGITYSIPIFINNLAWGGTEPASWVIERGRIWRPLQGRMAEGIKEARRKATGRYDLHRRVNHRQMGRWYGSLQAPGGVYGPAIQDAWNQRASIVSAALNEIERSI